MNLIFAFLTVSYASMIYSADVQKVDFKTFDPVAYFKRDLKTLKTDKPKQAQIKIYCDRLHKYVSALFLQQQLAQLFCGLIPAIGPSKKYEKYRLVEGLLPQGAIVEQNLSPDQDKSKTIIDSFGIGMFPRSNVKGILIVKSMQGVATTLSIGDVNFFKDPEEKIKRNVSVVQNILKNPVNEETEIMVGNFMYKHYFAKITNLLVFAMPILCSRWLFGDAENARELKKKELTDGPIHITRVALKTSPVHFIRTEFSEDFSKVIPLFAEMLEVYAVFARAYFNSGFNGQGIITPELEGAKRQMSEVLDKMGEHTDTLSKNYELAMKTLFEKKRDITSNNKSILHIFYVKEFDPSVFRDIGVMPNDQLLDQIKQYKTWKDLPKTLDFSCIYDKNRREEVVGVDIIPEQRPIELEITGHGKASAAAAAEFSSTKQIVSLPQADLVQVIMQPDIKKQQGLVKEPIEIDVAKENIEVKVAEEKIPYARRILDWLNPTLIQNETPRSILYHTFSFLADPIIKKYGKDSIFVASDRKNHPTYHLVGEIEYLSGQKMGKKELYVFVNTYDPKGTLYHRGIEPIKQGENFFQDFFSKSYMNVQNAVIDAQPAGAPAVGQDAVVSENDYSIVINDTRNNVKITLLKPLEGTTYN